MTWTVILSIAYTSVYYTCRYQWNRYLANPTVMAMERDYRSWNGTLPAVTLCYKQKVDYYKADEFLQK